MKSVRAATAAVLITTASIAAWASPASAHHAAVVTARKVEIKPGTNQMTCALPPNALCDPSPGNNAVVRVVVPDELRPVHQVCFTFRFEGDLVEPGESLTFLNGTGFVNIGSTAIAQRTICLDCENQPDDTRLFRDGRQTMSVWMDHGSAYLSSLDVVVTGRRP